MNKAVHNSAPRAGYARWQSQEIQRLVTQLVGMKNTVQDAADTATGDTSNEEDEVPEIFTAMGNDFTSAIDNYKTLEQQGWQTAFADIGTDQHEMRLVENAYNAGFDANSGSVLTHASNGKTSLDSEGASALSAINAALGSERCLRDG